MALDGAERVAVASGDALRAWLGTNHTRTEGVWLVTYKKPHPDYLAYDAIVEACLCFGWIDSLPRKLDRERTMLYVAARKPGSKLVQGQQGPRQALDRGRPDGAAGTRRRRGGEARR